MSAYMFVYAPHACSSLELELHVVANHQVDAGS